MKHKIIIAVVIILALIWMAGCANDLIERRKELLYRGLRWTDLRRLNKETGRQTLLQRTIAGQSYSLPASDPRYTLLIPDNVISFNPGMHQNPR